MGLAAVLYAVCALTILICDINEIGRKDRWWVKPVLAVCWPFAFALLIFYTLLKGAIPRV